MPDPRNGTGEGGQHYQSTLRLVLTVLLSVISVSALVAFLVLCYRSHWKAGVLRALPEDHRDVGLVKKMRRCCQASRSPPVIRLHAQVVQERPSPGFRAPLQLAIQIQHPDG